MDHHFDRDSNALELTYRMATYIQVCLVWLIYGIAMLALEVWAALFERLHKYLL